MVYITGVHMSPGGTRHEHIASVHWQDPGTGRSDNASTARMVDWIDNQSLVAKVTSTAGDVSVGTVDGSPRFLRTYANDKWTDNLLALPRY